MLELCYTIFKSRMFVKPVLAYSFSVEDDEESEVRAPRFFRRSGTSK